MAPALPRTAPGEVAGYLPLPGQPRKICDAKVDDMIARTLESTASDATHRRVRKMASTAHLSRPPAGRIWQAFGLRRHRQDTSEQPTDPLFIDKVRDVVALDLSQPTRAVVLCNAPKSQIQALDSTQPMSQLSFGVAERRSHDFELHGSTTLFADLNLAVGRFTREWHKHRCGTELLKFLRAIEQSVPAELEIHLIMDNYGTHKAPAVRVWFSRHPRIHLNLHRRPVPGSIWWSIGSRCSPNGRSCAAYTATRHNSTGYPRLPYPLINQAWLLLLGIRMPIRKMKSVGRFCTRSNDSRH